MARRVSDPPALDTKVFVARLRDMVSKLGFARFEVFDDAYLPKFHRWIRAEGEYDGDGKGVADTINAHAVQVNAHEARLDQNAATLVDVQARLGALEDASHSSPFPA